MQRVSSSVGSLKGIGEDALSGGPGIDFIVSVGIGLGLTDIIKRMSGGFRGGDSVSIGDSLTVDGSAEDIRALGKCVFELN